MRYWLRGLFALFSGSVTASLYAPDLVDGLAAKGLKNIKKYVAKNPINGNCTIENAVYRQEWYVESPSRRKWSSD